MDMNEALAGAKWIWCAASTRPYHNVVRFRRKFGGRPGQTTPVWVTADARYELFINGEWVGAGPVRSWINPWPVDEYEIGRLLREGDNWIEVVVEHPGLSTFQYLHSPPGALARVGGAGGVSSDESWEVTLDERFGWPVPRISCMQGWEEQFDSRRELTWSNAAAVESEHKDLEPRPIPQLTHSPVCPVRVMAVETVRGAPYVLNINPRDVVNSKDKSANNIAGRVLVVTHIFAEKEQSVELHPPHHRPGVSWKLNGESLKFDDHTLQRTDTGVAKATLKPGWNVLMGRLPRREHYWWAVLNVWGHGLVFSARPERCEGPPWLTIGPFEGTADDKPAHDQDFVILPEKIAPGATNDLFESIWKSGTLTSEQMRAAYVEQASGRTVSPVDVYSLCASERVLGPATADNASAMLTDSSDWAVLHPAEDGDVRILLDFGKEIIGHHEFEIDAPAGTIVDNHNFEFIQPDGRFNLAEGMNNSFRYVCREGVQRYRTVVRRGFRYSWLSFRSFNRPIRVRFVRVLVSTYPQSRLGSFHCSDPALDRIWEAGVRSVECCSEDSYTDCPTYEQTFWVGDARNEAMVDLIANGDPRLSAHCLRLAARSLGRSEMIESQVPSGWQTLLPAWMFLWMRWAEEHFRATGDRALGTELLAAIDKNVDTVSRHRTERGLFGMTAWNMFDWAAMDTPGSGEITHLNCLAVLGMRQTAKMADELGRADLATKWRKLADAISSAVNLHLWDSDKRAYIDCVHADGKRSTVFSQQTHTAAHIAGVPTPDRAARVREIMYRAPEGFVTAGSPFFMFFLLEAQANEGDFAGMLQTIRDYWGVQTDAGATTFWEMYWKNEKRMTRSHCHGWSAAPTYFLSRYVLGVEPTEAGYGRVRVVPPVKTDLRWARGTVPTPAGALGVSWERKDDGLHVRVEGPAGVRGVVEVGGEKVEFEAKIEHAFTLS